MKKGIAIGLLTVASVALFGCQQQQPVTPAPQDETSTTKIKADEPTNTTTTNASLKILGTQETSAVKTDDKHMMDGSMEMMDTEMKMMDGSMEMMDDTMKMMKGSMESKDL